MAQLPPDDLPSGQGMVPTHADPPDLEPFVTAPGTALMFLQALEDYRAYQVALTNLVTPESRQDWGSFAEAAESFARFTRGVDWGLGTKGQRSEDGMGAYIPVVRDMPGDGSHYVADGDVLIDGWIISLVHRPALGGWLVHAAGPSYFAFDMLPRDA